MVRLDDADLLQRWRRGSRSFYWTAAPSPLAAAPPVERFGSPFEIGPATFYPQPAEAEEPFAWPCLIDRHAIASPVARMPDLGVTLLDFVLEHPRPEAIAATYRSLAIARAPTARHGAVPQYVATFDTPRGIRTLP